MMGWETLYVRTSILTSHLILALHKLVNRNSLTKDFPSLSDPFKNTIPGDLEDGPFSQKKYKYAEKGPLTVEQLLGKQKLTESGVVKSM